MKDKLHIIHTSQGVSHSENQRKGWVGVNCEVYRYNSIIIYKLYNNNNTLYHVSRVVKTSQCGVNFNEVIELLPSAIGNTRT